MYEKREAIEAELKAIEEQYLIVSKEAKDFDAMIRETKAQLSDIDPLLESRKYHKCQLEILYWLHKYSEVKDRMRSLERKRTYARKRL